MKENLTPRKLYENKAKLKEYQQILLRQDQAILKVKNEDNLDLARQAKVTASSELAGFEAKKVIDGYNRDVQDGDSHQWRASLASGEQYIELSWSKPQNLKSVEFTFDSGLNRHLRLSGEASVMKNQKRGRQPEMLMDYNLELYNGSTLVKKEEVTENILRKVVHSFDGISADRVRLVAKKAQEDENARVFEIRCYA